VVVVVVVVVVTDTKKLLIGTKNFYYIYIREICSHEASAKMGHPQVMHIPKCAKKNYCIVSCLYLMIYH
jgi:hypothetical protein